MENPMKMIGVFLCSIGIVWGAIAFNRETTVKIESQSFSSGQYTFNTPSAEVNNIGLLEQRRNHLMGAGLCILVGVVVLLGGVFQSASSANADGASNFKNTSSTKKLSFNGDLDLNDPNYQLFLTKKYSIERNNTLQKFVANDVVYDSLDEALAVFHTKESENRISLVLIAPSVNDRLQTLFAVVKKGEAMIETYIEIASIHEGSLTSNGFLSGYIVDINGAKNRIKNFEDLQPWFLENVKDQIG